MGATFIKNNTNTTIDFKSKLCSNHSNSPIWQQALVDKYITSGTTLPDAKYFNIRGRAYPDISRVGHQYLKNTH